MLVIAHSTTSTADMFAVGRRETRCSVEFGFLEHLNERQFGFLRSDRVDDLDGRIDHIDTADQRGDGQNLGAFVSTTEKSRLSSLPLRRVTNDEVCTYDFSDSQESISTTRLPLMDGPLMDG